MGNKISILPFYNIGFLSFFSPKKRRGLKKRAELISAPSFFQCIYGFGTQQVAPQQSPSPSSHRSGEVISYREKCQI
jgi:hypothetical protein